VQDVTVPERWTQERRREHTRNLLLDAAEEVFAKRGFEGASLEEIAETAGYTRGAIYKHFSGKEDMFLEANKRMNERYVQSFAELVDPGVPLDQLDVAAIAQRWREMTVRDLGRQALAAEFNLYLLRNPKAHALAVQQRHETVDMVATFIEQQAAVNGFRTKLPPKTLARIALAASDGIAFIATTEMEGDDLFDAFVELLILAWEPDDAPPKKPAAKKPVAKKRRP
jgi:AcrR family transcriptional regulator